MKRERQLNSLASRHIEQVLMPRQLHRVVLRAIHSQINRARLAFNRKRRRHLIANRRIKHKVRACRNHVLVLRPCASRRRTNCRDVLNRDRRLLRHIVERTFILAQLQVIARRERNEKLRVRPNRIVLTELPLDLRLQRSEPRTDDVSLIDVLLRAPIVRGQHRLQLVFPERLHEPIINELSRELVNREFFLVDNTPTPGRNFLSPILVTLSYAA